MARFSLEGIIKIFGSETAKKKIRALDKAVVGLQTRANNLAQGFSNANRGLVAFGAAGAAVGAGFGVAISQAGGFQQQLTRVAALTGDAKKNFESLADAALEAGSKTEFTGVQAGQALEFLSLAGFSAKDSIATLPIILDTAAAGALDLGRASDIVTDSMSALTVAFGQNENTVQRATRLSDIFAKVQASSNTNIEQLGEAVKFGGGSLANLEIPLEQIIAAMGKLADAGLKGSLGGTNLAQAFEKLTKPSETVKAKMKALGVSMDDLPIQDLPKLVQVLSGSLSKLKNPNEKAALATELFGVRGKRAFNALFASGSESLQKLTNELKKSENFAKKTADTQRKTFEGQRKSLVSAIEGSLIGLGNFFIKADSTFRDTFASLVKGVQDIATAFRVAGLSGDKLNKAMANLSPRQRAILEFAQNFKLGIEDAFTTAKSVFNSVKSTMVELFPSLKNNTGEVGRMVGKFSVLLALAAPLALGFAALVIGAGALFSGLGGIVTISKVFLGTGFSLLKFLVVLDKKIISLAIKTVPLLLKGLSTLGAVAAANPVGAIILGITAVIVAGVLLVKNWDSVSAFLMNTWNNLKNFFTNAGLGEIILKTILFPIRAALTPITELIRFVASSSVGKKLLGDSADFVRSVADKFSLFSTPEVNPTEADQKSQRNVSPPTGLPPSLQLVPPPKSSLQSSALQETALEKQRLSTPAVSDRPVSVNVGQAPIEASINLSVELDGEVLDRKLMKRSINNSERLGQNLSPKTRQRALNGSFAGASG